MDHLNHDGPDVAGRDRLSEEAGVRLLIAIPVHNEQKYVQAVLDKVRRFHDDILVIDDGSSDSTPQILAGRSDVAVIRHPQNRGYGQSLIDAFHYAAGQAFDWVITMDCDEQHEPEMIPQFVREIETDRWDVVSGSRYLQSHRNDDLPPVDRRSINGSLTKIINDLYRFDITDAFCGYKAHRVSAMSRLSLTETGYAFPMQFWPQLAKHSLRLTEIPVRLIYNDPNRYFGGKLDDAAIRLRHYLGVLSAEVGYPIPVPAAADAGLGIVADSERAHAIATPVAMPEPAAGCCCSK